MNGKAAEDATPDDIKALTKSEYVQLFQTLPAASLEELNGEFYGEILPMGPTYLLAYYVMHWRFGPGTEGSSDVHVSHIFSRWFSLRLGVSREAHKWTILVYAHNAISSVYRAAGWWQGKAFSRRDQVGYNTFFKDGHVHRRRNFDIYPGPSAYDDKQSLHLVYAKHNDGLVGRLHDELRCLNDDLFLGLGGSADKRNPGNSTAFIICGPARPLKKSEQEYN